MHTDPTERFSSRVGDYARHRPSYPAAVAELLERECGLAAGARVADVGSGTGLLAQLFLRSGCEVYGVEPNAAMRAAAEALLALEPRFHSVEGRAEDTKLPPLSMDFVSAGQAFHWFDPEAAHIEFARILKPGGWLVLVWNERTRAAGFQEDYEALIHEYAPETGRIVDGALETVFGARPKLARLENQQQFDLEGLQGRLRSSSYAPPPGAAGHEELMRSAAGLFARYQQNGLVTLRLDTLVYYGQLT